MNMQYLDTLAAAMGDSNLWWPAGEAIQHSQARGFLEQQGYQTVFVASGWDYTDIRDGDVFLSPYRVMLRNFPMAFISWTNLRFFGNSWMGISFPSIEENRTLILHDFSALADSASISGPKFVFAHIMAPHPPFIFGSDGGPAANNLQHPDVGSPGYAADIERYRQGYIDQVTFVNRKTLEMIDVILERSTKPPVIILQGDHGPDVYMDFTDPARGCPFERYSILNAYHLPGVPTAEIPVDVSPVNTFRLVFNHYFGTNLDLLPNRRFFSLDTQLYCFREITDMTVNTCHVPPLSDP